MRIYKVGGLLVKLAFIWLRQFDVQQDWCMVRIDIPEIKIGEKQTKLVMGLTGCTYRGGEGKGKEGGGGGGGGR